jgi:Skp family chaperone for outer membrane proteins
MKVFVFLFLFWTSNNWSFEILLEENKAETGTVGYVDVVKIFNIYSSSFKENFNKEVDERQKKVDEIKKELDHYVAKKEKLETEYQIAKMLEEFYKNIQLQKLETSSQTYSTFSTSTNSVDISTSSLDFSTNTFQISNSTLRAKNNEDETIVSTTNSSTTDLNSIKEPYIMMPGVGKFPLSNYKFSISSSTLDISNAITQLDQIISKLKNEISELKKKYDEELSKKAIRENEKIFKKIYDAIEEVSREEKVSIVVDKKSILFGRKTLDLTDKVIEKLRRE